MGSEMCIRDRLESPDPELDLVDRMSVLSTWETLDFPSADGEGEPQRMLPGSPMAVAATKIVDRKPARGGDYAEWLVNHLMVKTKGKTRDRNLREKTWQSVPPPLYQEGFKVQTSWLHKFLLNPEPIRNMTVLSMPKFNMSSEEAATLANYFAAVDGCLLYTSPSPRDS